MQCVAAGHTLAALANLRPEDKDELDSFMFQTVGHEAVELVAEAMAVPLYRAVTSGHSRERGLHYSPREGDEVEDLYHLLRRVQSSEGVEGVASGAVLSDYQRLRVENVCSRLGLTSLAYLWRRDQAQLLEEMVTAGLTAVLVKVAAVGLTEAHLGQSLQQMQSHLTQLHRRYGVHMCGEGGEYETLTLDCPLFTHRIIIDESEVVMVTPDKVAPVAYLKLHRLHLVKKIPVCIPRPLIPTPDAKVAPCIPVAHDVRCGGCGGGGGGGDGRVWRWGVFEGAGEDMSQQAHHVFSELSDWLTQCGSQARNVVLCRVSLSSMQDFSLLNSVYSTTFPSSPPARVCVQLSLPAGVLVRMEVLLCQNQEIVAMHVQSISHWAPANIGPYSQAVRAGKVVVTAGQIGLEPASMTPAVAALQPALALRHVGRVLEANHAHLSSALCGMCYYTTEEAGWAARMTWREQSQQSQGCGGCGAAVVFLRVPALPRGVTVEWHFIALTSPCQLHYHSSHEAKEGVGFLDSEMVTWCGDGEGVERDVRTPRAGAWLFVLIPHPASMGDMDGAVKTCVELLTQQLAASGVSVRDISQLQLFLPRFSSGTSLSAQRLQGLSGIDSVTVTTCEGYYGQNSSVSLLALLLPSPLP